MPRKKSHNRQTKAFAETSNKPTEEPIPKKTEPVRPNSLLGFELPFKQAFFGLLVVFGVLMSFIGANVGTYSDEIDMNVYGKNVLAYFTSGGEDTSYLVNETYLDRKVNILKHYGGGFEFVAAVVNTVIQPKDEYAVRHIMNVWVGILIALFVGLTARKIWDWRAAFFAALFILLSPRFFGHTLLNTKDIPFALSFAMAMYFQVRLFQEIPKVNWKTLLGCAVAIAMGINVRAGGLLLIAYFGFFTGLAYLLNKELRKQLFSFQLGKLKFHVMALILVPVLGFAGGLIFWPEALANPIKNPFNSLDLLSKFPQIIPVLWEGEITRSNEIPSDYIPRFFTKTVPEVLMALVVLSLPLYFIKRKSFSGLTIFYLIFCFVFPIYYVISKDANLYGGWRHLLFIYAPFIVLSVFTLEFFLRKFQSKLLVQGLVLSIIIIGLVPAVKGIISYSPYQYTWFNTHSGGIKKNFNVYDTDYQQVCLKEGLDWLIENENILERETPLKIASNAPYAMEYYEELYDSAFTAVFANYKGLKAQEWDYAIVNTLFVLPKVVDINYPPKGVVYRIKADGVPIGVVLKRENTYLLDGLNYMNSGRLQEGIQVLNKAFAYNSKDPYVWYLLGMAYHNTGDAKSSNNMLEAYAGIYGHDVSTMQAIGLNYLTLENYKQAQQYLNAVVSNGSKDPSVYYGLALAIYSQQGNKNQIASLCQQAVELNPNYRPAQILLNTVSK